MKLFAVLVLIVSAYMYMLFHTTDVVLGQTKQLELVYQRAAEQ